MALLHEFVHAGGKDALFHAGSVAGAVGRVEQFREFRAAPKTRLEIVGLTHGAAHDEEFLEDDRPAGKRKHDQNSENGLHDQTRVGDEREDRKIGSGVHNGKLCRNE